MAALKISAAHCLCTSMGVAFLCADVLTFGLQSQGQLVALTLEFLKLPLREQDSAISNLECIDVGF